MERIVRGQDYSETSDIYSSSRIKAFLDTVQEGDNIAFIDNDQTITKTGIDTEDLSLNAGIIPQAKRAQSGEELIPSQGIDTQAVGQPALDALRKILGMYTSHVTDELSSVTGIPVGTVMNSDVLRKVGRHVGKKLIDEDLLRENAIDIIKALMENNIRPVIVTATPVDIVEGVYESLNEEYKFSSHITILGTELVFDQEGHSVVGLHMFGPPKTALIEASKERGAIALFGIGDKPLTSDAFMWRCENPVPINDKEYGEFGEKQWKALVAISRNSV